LTKNNPFKHSLSDISLSNPFPFISHLLVRLILLRKPIKQRFPQTYRVDKLMNVNVVFDCPGAIDGLKYMVHVDWDKLMEGDTWINGATQATNTTSIHYN
jgi:hypothetical protein